MTTLQDSFGRNIEYLRLSVTDRCDLRCSYCIPQGFHGFETPEHWLTFDEIERVVAVFARLGVARIRLTGGEPLTRPRIADLAQRLCALPGVSDLSLSTNATLLSRYADDLFAAGVSRLNVSLDSLDAPRLAGITGRDCLAHILDGLTAAKQAGFAPIKINMVVLGGENEHEVESMVEFCMEHGFILRLIETMPMGDSGRNARYVNLQAVRQRLQQRFGLIDGVVSGGGPARYLRSVDGGFSLGFITPISQHFCATCNRVRLSADGTLYLCLGQEDTLDLRSLLRAGITDAGLQAAICEAIARKPERHEFKEQPNKIVRIMSQTGG
ncbi:MAG: GTP 3',8-cyclase MoaA [Gallionellaceae bacterium]|nr:MAG: GTP 3',8-cyclase MoaA [Gallionellaceae bacterium]